MGPKKRKPDKPDKGKPNRTPEEQRKVDENRANKGKTIGHWEPEKMRQAVER